MVLPLLFHFNDLYSSMGFGDIEKHDYKKYLTIYFTIYARIFEITSLEFYRPPRKISAVIVISPDFLSPLMLK